MPSFKTNDAVKIHYQTYGAPENQAVVFINGYSASEATWILQIESFKRAGFYVVSYDHRLHGRSDKVDYGLTIQRLAFDLKELLDELKLSQPILIGHSMGASVILAYEQLFTDKDLLAVITEDQAPLFLKAKDWLDGFGRELSDLPRFMDSFPQIKLTRKPLSIELKRELGHTLLPFDFKAGRPLLQNAIVQDWRTTLTREEVPHLFLAGSDSPIFPSSHAAAALALTKNPKSEAKVFDGCGHILHLESPAEFDEIILKFIQRVIT
ncbi:MAG: alpha/beta hydrolase [Streptococcaceae bacterium]|jgi:pimeloyl-ACP methyl ester carboxylesterase|nr:alpha/beta hydrolase [Streptococcaceae bacterium]